MASLSFARWLSRCFGRKKRPIVRPARSRPTLETLEDRITPSAVEFGFALAAGNTGSNEGRAIATNGAGNVYVTGFLVRSISTRAQTRPT